MTKINKLGKSTFVIAILSFLLVAVLAFGGTYAYFSAQSNTVSGSVTTGHLTIGEITGNALDDTDSSKIELDTLLQPNQIVLNDTLGVDVNSNIKYYARVKFEVTVGASTHQHKVQGTDPKCADNIDKAIDALAITPDSDWKPGNPAADDGASKSSKYYYLTTALDGDSNADGANDIEFTVVIQAKAILGLATEGSADGCEYWMDVPVTISLTFEVLQAEYLFAGEDDDNDTENGSPTDAVVFADGVAAETAWNKALKGEQGTKPVAGA